MKYGSGTLRFHMQRYYDLWGCVAIALLTPLLMLSSLWLLRVPLGLVLVLFAPGYTFITALFARQATLDGPERLGLGIGLSVALVPFFALLLNWLPWGIRQWPIVLCLSSWVVLCSAIAALRRWRYLAAAEAALPPVVNLRDQLRALSRKQLLGLGLGSVLFIGLAVGTVYILTAPDPTSIMTEFYVLGQAGLAEDYPREAVAGEPLTITMGLVNREQQTHTYRVEAWAVDSWLATQREHIGESPAITLAPGASDERALEWTMPWLGADQKVEFLLFRDDQSQPYRQLHLWMSVVEPQPDLSP